MQAGSLHTCFLSDDGKLFSCESFDTVFILPLLLICCCVIGGDYEYNGHGLKEDLCIPTIFAPSLFGEHEPRICQVSIHSGGYHTIVLTETDEIYTWGHNRCGQLGSRNMNADDQDRNASQTHILKQNRAGALYAAVPGRFWLPLSNPAPVKQVCAGWGHSAVLLSDGSLYMLGRNECGQLGIGDKSKCKVNERGHRFWDQPFLVKGDFDLNGIDRIDCGGEFSIITCDNNIIYGTGNGLLCLKNCHELIIIYVFIV